MRQGLGFVQIDATNAAPKQARRIKPTRRSVSGVYMFRGGEALEFESTLERDFLIREEFFTCVLGIVPQPCQLQYRDPATGRFERYTPDFLVYYRLGSRDYTDYPKPQLVEVKPEADWRKYWRRWLPKWKAAYRYAQSQGWSFHIRDESRIRDQTLRNISFLSRYKRMIFPEEESLAVLESVARMGSTTAGYLLARHFMGMYRREGIAHLWHLLGTRRLDCDISRPLSASLLNCGCRKMSNYHQTASGTEAFEPSRQRVIDLRRNV